MFREIRGVQQRDPAGRRRWFQDPFFDLFVTQSVLGRTEWFQLCYLRDTRRERVLEWKRGRGFLHMKVAQPSFAADRGSGGLMLDGMMPVEDVLQAFAASAATLPREIAAFVDRKVREYERPALRFRRPGVATPRWLERLRRRTL